MNFIQWNHKKKKNNFSSKNFIPTHIRLLKVYNIFIKNR